MLDPVAYRASESSAKRAIADWRLTNINDPYIFQNQGFPVRVDSFLDLAQILDTMQEGRFDWYMREVGGFTDEDADRFLNACVDYIDFHVSCFQKDRVVVPLSTLISHFVIYKKLLGYNSGFKRLLEVGPGCGYLSFFLRDHPGLVDYTQIESTESFYLLQSHINSHVFGSRFAEHALSGQAFRDHGAYVPKLKWYTEWHYETQKIINIQTRPVCNHFPWWRIADAAQRRYDLITCNANLNEFSREALFQYLSLFRDVLADDGAIVAQCLGGGAPTYETIFANMKSAGFVPVALVAGDNVPGRNFVVSNGVFVSVRHPLYAEYANVTPQFPMLDRNSAFINRMYFLNEHQAERKQVMSAHQLLRAILERIDPAGRRAAAAEGKRRFGGGVKVPALEGGEKLSEAVVFSAQRREVMGLRKAAQLDTVVAEIEPEEDVAPAAIEGRRGDAEAEFLVTEVARLKRRLAEFHGSRSWRITKPLRSFSGWVRERMPRLVRFVRWLRA